MEKEQKTFTAPPGEKEQKTATLGILEEDDEFDEFPVEGNLFVISCYKHFYRLGR
jgi:hypothetical protein